MPQATKQRLYTPALKAFTAYRTPAFMTPMSEEERERVLFARSEAKKPKRLFTPLPVKDRQTRLSDEELEAITRATITRQLAREAAREATQKKVSPLKEALIGTGSVTGKPSALGYIKELPETLAKVTSEFTSAAPRLAASFGASSLGRKEPLPAPSKVFAPKTNLLTRYVIGEQEIKPFTARVDLTLNKARNVAAAINKKKPEQVTWDEMLTPTVFFGLGLGAISAAEADISIGGGKGTRKVLEQAIKQLKEIRLLENVDPKIFGKAVSETAAALKAARGGLEGIGTTIDDLIREGDKILTSFRGEAKVISTKPIAELPKTKPLLPSAKPPVSKISAKEEFRVGDILDPQGKTNMVGKVTIREITGNTLKFIDSKGTEYIGMQRSLVRDLIKGGSWKRVTQPQIEKAKPKTAPFLPTTKQPISQIPAELEPLAQEAKAIAAKYPQTEKGIKAGTEEFVGANQSTVIFYGNMYHTAPKEILDIIQRGGFRLPKIDPRLPFGPVPNSVHLGLDYNDNQARGIFQGWGGDSSLLVKPTRPLRLYEVKGSQKTTKIPSEKTLKKQGYDGVYINDTTPHGDGVSVHVFNPKLVRPQFNIEYSPLPRKKIEAFTGKVDYPKQLIKSQLTDIYNQAVKAEKITKPLAPTSKPAIEEPLFLTGQTAMEGEGFFMSPSNRRYLKPEVRLKIEIEAVQKQRTEAEIKTKIQEVKFKGQEKVAEVKEKAQAEIKELTQRRERLQASRDFLGLSDDDIRKVSRKDIRFMQKDEFSDFLNNLEAKSTQLVEDRQLKNEIVSQIQNKELKKVDNLRQFLEFPKLEDMSAEQLKQFNDALIPFQKGDEFLSLRKLQTVDNTELKGIRTLREAKERLAKKLNVPLIELNNIKVSPLDRFRYDTALARRNEFYRLLVDETNQSMLAAEKRFLELKQEINNLTKKARTSSKRSLIEKAVPTDNKVWDWLSTPEMGEKASDITKSDILKEMTPQEIDLANYLQVRFAEFRDYLLEHKTLEKYRSNYIVHIRRGFLEAWKEDGLLNAFKEVFAQYKLEEATFKILDDDTQNILPLEKFFQFAMRRTGELKPSKNVAQAFLAYSRAFLKKQALDRIVPELDIYTYSLTPRRLTPRGLEMDRTLKKFVNEWINTKKGRVTSFGGLIPQGGAIDIGLRGIKSFVTLLDLGLNIPVGLTVQIGEQVTNFVSLGSRQYAQGIFRMNTAKGKRVVEKYKNFVGESPWRTLSEASDTIGDTFNKGLFSLFHDAQTRANKGFLLGSLSPEEWATETLNDERLALLKRELGRYRVVSGAKSIWGATSAGGIALQYKTWAVPILSSTLDNISQLGQMIGKRQFAKAIKSKNFHELFRATMVTLGSVLIVGSLWGDDDDKSFIGKIKAKAYRDSLSVLGAIDPRFWTNPTRVGQFLENLGKSITQIILLKKYKTKEGFKGVEGLKRTLTPTAAKQIFGGKEETKKESETESFIKQFEKDIGLNIEKEQSDFIKQFEKDIGL